jgi:tetratricopeptide (TPR) repeat protein
MVRRATEKGAPTPWEAFILARTCSVARKSPVAPARAVEWANQTVAATHNPWDFHALGLAQLRAGQFDQARRSFVKADVPMWAYRDINWFGLALAHHRLGNPDRARQCLDQAAQWLEREAPRGRGRPANIHPTDWLEAQLLRREAEELIGPRAKAKPDKK